MVVTAVHVYAFEIGPSQIVSAVVGCVSAAVILLGIFDKRRKDISQTWKDLYEAKSVELTERDKRLARLEAEVDLLKSDFSKNLADGVTTAILRILDDRGGLGPHA